MLQTFARAAEGYTSATVCQTTEAARDAERTAQQTIIIIIKNGWTRWHVKHQSCDGVEHIVQIRKNGWWRRLLMPRNKQRGTCVLFISKKRTRWRRGIFSGSRIWSIQLCGFHSLRAALDAVCLSWNAFHPYIYYQQQDRIQYFLLYILKLYKGLLTLLTSLYQVTDGVSMAYYQASFPKLSCCPSWLKQCF